MELYIGPGGRLRCLYGEALDLATLGRPQIVRASFVEPDGRGRWHADLAPVGGPTLGPFAHRSEALAAEAGWLARHAFGDHAPGACRGDHDPIGPRGGPLMRTTASVMLIRRGLRWLGRRPTAERLARAARLARRLTTPGPSARAASPPPGASGPPVPSSREEGPSCR